MCRCVGASKLKGNAGNAACVNLLPLLVLCILLRLSVLFQLALLSFVDFLKGRLLGTSVTNTSVLQLINGYDSRVVYINSKSPPASPFSRQATRQHHPLERRACSGAHTALGKQWGSGCVSCVCMSIEVRVRCVCICVCVPVSVQEHVLVRVCTCTNAVRIRVRVRVCACE